MTEILLYFCGVIWCADTLINKIKLQRQITRLSEELDALRTANADLDARFRYHTLSLHMERICMPLYVERSQN